jgi:hypothetical protein
MVERPITNTFEYYGDIASYHLRYPIYYGKIDVLYESNGLLKTKEFLNLNLDKNIDHLLIEVEYHIDKPNKISFKITANNFIKSISGGLTFIPQEFYYKTGTEEEVRREGTLVNGTISALAVISLPPGSKDSSQYEDMLIYFGERDAEFLEGKPSFQYRAGQQCTKCGKGRLKFSGKKEHTRINREFPLKEQHVTIEVLFCDVCRNPFENTFIRLK